MQIAEALRLLRTRRRLTQTAASKTEGAPDFRTLSHWETGRKYPSYKLLRSYLRSQDFDFHDSQDALDLVEGKPPKRFRRGLRQLKLRLEEVEERVVRLEADAAELAQGLPAGIDDAAELADGQGQAAS